MKYATYLASPLWKKIRARVMGRDGGRCRSCSGRATEVHHGSYDRLTMAGGADHNLYAICRACHEAVTFDASGRKRPMREVAAWSRTLGGPSVQKIRAKAKKKAAKKKSKWGREARVMGLRRLK